MVLPISDTIKQLLYFTGFLFKCQAFFCRTGDGSLSSNFFVEGYL